MALQSARGVGRARRTVLAGAMALGFVLSLAPTATAEHYEGTVELRGATPIEAAIAFSQIAFPGGAPQAALGRDDAFADSLASGILQTTSPLLLTGTATLAPAVDTELKRLGVTTVHILGGPSAISPAVEQQLIAGGYTVRRHRGPTRIDTAVEIARAIAPSASEVLIARAFGGGEDATQAFADSLAAGAWSASSGNPVLLTESDKLSAATQAYLQSATPVRAYVIGGTSAIADAVIAEIQALGIEVQRVSGPTRFDTAVEIAERRGIDGVTDTNDIVLLEGQAAGAWAPGFAAAAYAAVERAPVLLATGATLPPATSAFLNGGDPSIGLLCAPQLAEAACDAAAVALEKNEAPKVTLNEGSVAQYANVTGTITPAEEVLRVVANGCGLTDRDVVVDQDGSFETRIEGAPGTCTLEFQVETRNLGSFKKTFPLTVTEAAQATAFPELVKVETVSSGAQFATVRYVFSEIIKATEYDRVPTNPPTAHPHRLEFLLYGARGTQRFTALDGVPEAGNIADPGAPPRRDPANNRAVLVDFRRVDYDQATAAAVTALAAVDLDDNDNIPGSAPLKALTLPAARTDEEDLESVGSISAQGMAPGKFRAVFTFDEIFDSTDPEIAAEAFGVVLTDGRLIRGESPSKSGRTYTVTFSVAATEEPDGTVCSGTGCPTVQQAMSGVRRGYVSADGRPLQAVKVAVDGVTDRPDLVSVALDIDEGTADFTFDADVDDPDASQFSLWLVEDVSGNVIILTAQSAAVVSDRVVRITAPVSKLVVGGSVGPGAVSGGVDESAPDTAGIAQTFAAGEVLGPVLVHAVTEFVETTGNQNSVWRVIWTFDEDVEAQNTGLLLYTNTSTATRRYTSTHLQCATEGPSITCQIALVNPGETPAVAAVNSNAVRAPGAVPDTQLENIERSVRL